MTDERTLKTELARLLLTGDCSQESYVTHQEGRIRGIVFALTGNDIGPRCGFYRKVAKICEWLGWKCKPCGETGWEIDYGDEVDEATLADAGVEIV